MPAARRDVALSTTRPPVNEAEAECVARLQARGWTVCRRGWPDFIAVKDGRIIAIEVKPRHGQPVKREQAFVLDWLARAGLDVYTWTPDDQHPVPWSAPSHG
jgi:hypothetical protein